MAEDYWHDKCHRCVHLDESGSGPNCKKFDRPISVDHHWTQEPVRLAICVETDAKKEPAK